MDNINYVFDELSKDIKANCKHHEFLSSGYTRVENIWPDSEFDSKQFFINDSSFKQCARCYRVFLPKEYKNFSDDLKDYCLGLSKLLPQLGEIRLQFGSLNVQSRKPQVRVKMAEKGKFKVFPARFKMSDVILPTTTLEQVEEAIIKIKFHKKIYQEWGFEQVDPIGLGAVILFHGPPGTGKSRCAEALAGEMDKPFMLIGPTDLAGRYLGDYSKNISMAFQSARETGALLFFDEAYDVLGERFAEVTQGAESEINSARSTLLMELERFEGVVVFATNYYKRIEEAFHRRIAHHVQFGIPDVAVLRRLWELHLVPGIPLAEERGFLITTLATLSQGLTGGDIIATLRIALPSAVRIGGDAAVVSLEILTEALNRVRNARRESKQWQMPKAELLAASEMFGFKQNDDSKQND